MGAVLLGPPVCILCIVRAYKDPRLGVHVGPMVYAVELDIDLASPHAY